MLFCSKKHEDWFGFLGKLLCFGVVVNLPLLVFELIIATIGKPVCFLDGVVCFVRPEWWLGG